MLNYRSISYSNIVIYCSDEGFATIGFSWQSIVNIGAYINVLRL